MWRAEGTNRLIMELSNLLLLQVTFCLAYLTTGGLGQFSFIPSPNIIMLQSAVYRCSVDEGIPLTWTVNGASSSTTAWQPYIDSVGITLDGHGTNNGVLTIPGNNITLNGSTVECAYGIINGIVYGDSDSSTLYIQGPPSTVGVTCQFQLPFINCSWSTPFTLPNIHITHYVVNITDSNGPVVLENITDTQCGCTIEQLGLYTISVTPCINDLEGETDSTQVTLDTSFTSNISLYHDNQDQLIMNVILVGLDTHPDTAILSVKSVKRSGNYSIDWNYGSFPVSGVVNVTDMSRIKHVSVDIMVNYSGLSLNSNKTHFIDTFDVIDVTNEILISTDNMVIVCFECIFNPTMLNPRGCNVTYTSTNDTAHGSVWSTTQRACSNILHEYIYDIMVYDINKNGISYDEEPAIQLQDVSFHPTYTGTTPTAISVIISTVTSSTTSSTGTTLSNTPTLPTRSTTSSTTIVVITISGAVIVILILITFLVLLLIAIIKKRFSTHQKNRFKAVTLQQDVPLQTNPCYQTVQVPINRNGCSGNLDTVYENIQH